jgi:2'-5' RNA ligase
LRLFVAFEVPAGVRREVARRVEAARRDLPTGRWVDAEKLHLTLLFLGETPEAEVPALAERLAPVFARRPPLPLRLAGGGTFPPRRPARVAWVGVEAPPELLPLQADVTGAAVAALGFTPEERPYHPHITLARCPSPWPRPAIERFTAAFAGPIGEPFTAGEGVLFESRLSPKGARYTPVATFPLEAE